MSVTDQMKERHNRRPRRGALPAPRETPNSQKTTARRAAGRTELAIRDDAAGAVAAASAVQRRAATRQAYFSRVSPTSQPYPLDALHVFLPFPPRMAARLASEPPFASPLAAEARGVLSPSCAAGVGRSCGLDDRKRRCDWALTGYNGLLRSNSRLSHISGPHFLHQTEHWLLQMGCTASYRLSNDHTWVCPKGAGHHRLMLKLRSHSDGGNGSLAVRWFALAAVTF
uniref:Uncharacterized protein n=1 Tax=Oryza nivara TaxID=4536 RepID=A0A0E0GJ08_ORYNI